MRKLNNKLLCFSPPVMLATVIVEIALLLYSVWRYKWSPVVRLVVLMLFFLASFQWAEYMICGGLGWSGVEWARYGYLSITLLPALGLHLATVLAKKRMPWLIGFAYLSAAFFAYFFVFVNHAMYGEVCRANYVVFHVRDWLVYLYSTYYYGWLLVTIGLALTWAKKGTNARQLRMLALSYAVFIIPTTLANIINPDTIAGIPSIMCGFAVLTALLLVFGVLPGAAKHRS